MKILLFIDGLGSGGAERQISELAVGLKNRGHEPTIVFYHPAYHYLDYLVQNNVKTIELHRTKRLDLKFLISLIALLKKEKPHYIISFKTITNIWILASSILANYRNVIISERNIDIQYYRFHAFLERILVFNAKYIIFTMPSILCKNFYVMAISFQSFHYMILVCMIARCHKQYPHDKITPYKISL